MKNIDTLLSNLEVARFVDEGYIILEGVIAEELCQRAIDETRSRDQGESYLNIKQMAHHYPWAEALNDSVYKEIIDSPIVRGALESLTGPDPLFDHCRNHRSLPIGDNDSSSFLRFHQDCVHELRPFSFDVNVSIYPQAVTQEMGGTAFVPGSQYRRMHNNNFYRYQNIRGSKQLCCAAGTVVLWHGNLWHSGRPNVSESDRIMFITRFNPRAAQIRTWNTENLAEDQEAVAQLMLRGHAWMGGEHPIEWVNRIRQWRYMSGDHDFDFMGYTKRISMAYAQDDVDAIYHECVRQGIPQ